MLAAKTVYIVNKTGMQAITDGAYEEFTKWGRYTIVKAKDKADIIATYSNSPELFNGTSHPVIGMVISLAGSDDAAYQIIPKARLFRSWEKVAMVCVDDFQKRVQESQP